MDSISPAPSSASAKLVTSFTVQGEPASKARARFTKRGSKTVAYTPEKTKQAESAVAAAYLKQVGKREADANKAFAVHVDFYHGTSQRRDTDNMLKLVLDGLNTVAFPDDSQVIEVLGRKTLVARDDGPRTEVNIYYLGDIQRRTKICDHCEQPFPSFESWSKTKKFCSAQCRNESRRAARKRKCEHCDAEFLAHGPQRETKYCSKECSYDARRQIVTCDQCQMDFSKQRCHIRETNYCSDDCMVKARSIRRKSKMVGACQVCGEGTTRKEYKRCNDCRLKDAQPAGAPKQATLVDFPETNAP